MAVSKFYARWRRFSGEEEIVNAFQAIKLKKSYQLVTDPQEQATLFDIGSDSKIYPVYHETKEEGRYTKQPYFAYYRGSSPLKGSEGSFEYSHELTVFLEAFKDIHSFVIKNGDELTTIVPKKVHRFHRVETDDNSFFILKFLIELESTKPYSSYYRYNGKLGIELYHSQTPTPRKRVTLGNMGIPLFEAKAFFPKYTQNVVKDEFTHIDDINFLASEIRTLYENKNYQLFGRFDKYHLDALVFLGDNERKYRILKSYEDQCQELQAEIKQLEESFSQKSRKADQLREQITQAEGRLRHYCEKEEYYKKLEKDNQRLIEEKRQLQSDIKRLSEDGQRLRADVTAAQEETKALRNRSFLQRLFNKE